MIQTLAELQKEAYSNSEKHGFWEDAVSGWDGSKPIYDTRIVPEKLCLIHSEISEALEHFRSGRFCYFRDEKGKPDGFGVELADAIIRIADLAEAFGIDLTALVNEKHQYNVNRPYKHGKAI